MATTRTPSSGDLDVARIHTSKLVHCHFGLNKVRECSRTLIASLEAHFMDFDEVSLTICRETQHSLWCSCYWLYVSTDYMSVLMQNITSNWNLKCLQSKKMTNENRCEKRIRFRIRNRIRKLEMWFFTPFFYRFNFKCLSFFPF